MTATTNSATQPTDAEIESQILTVITDLAAADGDLVPWSRVRSRLPRREYWPLQHALYRLWQRGDVVQVKVSGSPHVGLADECSRMADAARERRGEPRRLLVL
ncbi:hypothetical protein IA539_08885 [Gordonia sp. zg691]|uniref:hypothetical protein n=1 Tax=Gordonia jinghuaiqii TaxID=2758710 RepID=UPI0016622DBE|nr:hypothetical protein [Gordonia jinghuaiqii]MBD0861327.1 hypothetical protein [Gordonia jinghuaiqii]